MKIVWKMWKTGKRYDGQLYQRNQIWHGSWVLTLIPITEGQPTPATSP